jgi:hypothetical protein
MNAQIQAFSRSVSIDGAQLDRFASSPRTKYVLAHVLMVAGYCSLIVNPFGDDALSLGLICQAIALLLYVSSKQNSEIKNCR